MPIIESFDLVLRKFKRACDKAGILAEIKKKEFYEKPTIKRKKAKYAAIKKYSKNKKKKIINKYYRKSYESNL